MTSGRCAEHERQGDRERGTAAERGYGAQHRTRFRTAVLRRDPICVCEDQAHGHGPRCLAPSKHADHWPRDKRELRRLSLDEHDPRYGRGLCHRCHSQHTAIEQPGGWNA